MSAKTNLRNRKTAAIPQNNIPQEVPMSEKVKTAYTEHAEARYSAPPVGWSVSGPQLPIKDGYEGLAYTDPENLPIGAQPEGYRAEYVKVEFETGTFPFTRVLEGVRATLTPRKNEGWYTLTISKPGQYATEEEYGGHHANKNMVISTLRIIRELAKSPWFYAQGVITKSPGYLTGGGYAPRDPHYIEERDQWGNPIFYKDKNGNAKKAMKRTERACAYVAGWALPYLQAVTFRKANIEIHKVDPYGMYACHVRPDRTIAVTHRTHGNTETQPAYFGDYANVAASLDSGPLYFEIGPDTLAEAEQTLRLLNAETDEERTAAIAESRETAAVIRGQKTAHTIDNKAVDNIRENALQGEAPRKGEGVAVYNGKKQTVTVEMLQKDIENVKKAYPQAKDYQIRFVSVHRKTGVETPFSIKGSASLEERAIRINQGFTDWYIGVAVDPSYRIKA